MGQRTSGEVKLEGAPLQKNSYEQKLIESIVLASTKNQPQENILMRVYALNSGILINV